MGLWVMNQECTNLAIYQRFYIEWSGNFNKFAVRGVIGEEDVTLGLYHTREDAEVVLLEILNWIDHLEYLKSADRTYVNSVYQMP